MKSYKIKVTFFNGSSYKFQRTAKKVKAQNNVNNLVFNKFRIEDVKKIEVLCWNDNTSKFYTNLTYDSQLEQWKRDNKRIERISDGMKERFYLGRSTGWIPIYLEIKNSRSTGGTALFNKDLRVVY